MLCGMLIQNQIKRTLSTPANIAYLRQMPDTADIRHRTDLAQRVCGQFGFQYARGQLQVSGCLKALRELERSGHLSLPRVDRATQSRKSSRSLGQAVAVPIDLPRESGAVQGLQLGPDPRR